MKASTARKLALAGILVLFLLGAVSTAGAQPGQFVKGVLQPLADGFPKESLKMIVVDDPGSKDDLYAKSLQASAKGMSPVPILVGCEPAASGGTWFTIQDVARRAGGKDGYYLVIDGGSFGMVTDLVVDPSAIEIGAKLEQLNMVIASDFWPYPVIQRKNAPWGPKFMDMIKYGKANPGKLRFIARLGGGQHIAMSYILKTLGVEVKTIVGGSHQDCASAVGAGEADFVMSPMDTALSNWRTGRVDLTFVTGSYVPDAFKGPNVVSAKDVGVREEIGGSLFGLGVPSEVPQAHVDWLYKLFNAAAKTEIHKKRLTTLPGTVFMTDKDGNFLDSKQANAMHKEILRIAEPVIRSVGLAADQQK